jgi:quercetin dioxygenase-like cupin family protein
METKEKPSMTPITTGEEFKALAVTGKKGMEMPLHKATGEAVIIVRKGAVKLNIDKSEKALNKGDVHIIPARRPHSVKILEDFEAIVLMAVKSDIVFN